MYCKRFVLITDIALISVSESIQSAGVFLLVALSLVFTTDALAGKYRDGRPEAKFCMVAQDQGVVLRHGDGPNQCDIYGARDVWVFEADGSYYMHYDAAGPKGWLCALATSKDLINWEKRGTVLDLGEPNEDDSKSASYGTTFFDGSDWHMFYLGAINARPAPRLIPSLPYLIMKAKSSSPMGPWIKQKDVCPLRPRPGTYYEASASPGCVIKHNGEYLQFFSGATFKGKVLKRTIGLARTINLDGEWAVDPVPILPQEEQIENTSIYYEESNKTWFLFTNHIGIDKYDYADAIWVYWTTDINKWDPNNKALVFDVESCKWSKGTIGLPSVIKFKNRLAVFYDGHTGNSLDHMERDVGLAWLDLPLVPPRNPTSTESRYK